MPGSRNLDYFSGLVTSEKVEENLLPPLCSTAIIPYYIQKYIFTSTNNSLKANRDYHRKPQLNTTQRSTDHEELRPSGYLYSIVPTSVIQRTLVQRTQKECQSQKFRKLGVNASPKSGCKTKHK